MYATGKRALGECDVCGFTYLLRELRALVVSDQTSAVRACRSCWNADHPQNRPLQITVDNEALRDPRPDHKHPDMLNIAWGWNPVFGVQATGSVGVVTVTIG